MEDTLRELLQILAAGVESDGRPAVLPQRLEPLYVLARRHCVDAFVFAQLPALGQGENKEYDTWRAVFLQAVPRTMFREEQLREILAAFHAATIPVIPLKGAWLSETVYGDPALRSMSDLDLLVPAAQAERAGAELGRLGYLASGVVVPGGNPFRYDVAYRHPERPLAVELHWNVFSEQTPHSPAPDMDAVWRATRPVELLGQPILSLPPEDGLNHLAQHILHHAFSVPLRAYLDIALLVHKSGAEMTAAGLDAAEKRWKTGQAVPLVLWMTREFLKVALPPLLDASAKAPPDEYKNGLLPLLLQGDKSIAQQGAEESFHSLGLLPFWERPWFLLRKTFCPQACLIVYYPWARHWPLVPFAWVARAFSLVRRYSSRIVPDKLGRAQQEVASLRYALVEWAQKK
jgi:hypothetical protein